MTVYFIPLKVFYVEITLVINSSRIRAASPLPNGCRNIIIIIISYPPYDVFLITAFFLFPGNNIL